MQSEIDKEALMHKTMHTHDLRSRKGCARLRLAMSVEAPAFEDKIVS